MRRETLLQHRAPALELLVGIVIALFFYLVLGYSAAAVIILGAALLLSMAVYLVREEMATVRESVAKRFRRSHDITHAISLIEDPECRDRASRLVTGLGKKIELLQRGFIPLDETEFLLEGAKAADAAVREIRSVNPLTPGWETRGGFINYYQSNLRAVARGVPMTRIFVFSRERLDAPEVQAILLAHLRDGIRVRVAFRDELPAVTEADWGVECSFNFGIFDGSVVIDVFPHPGKYYGIKTSQPAEVGRYLRLYELVDHAAHDAAVEKERVVVR